MRKVGKSAIIAVAIVVFSWYLPVQRVYALAQSIGPNGSNCQAVHQLGETGAGVNIGLLSAGNVLTTHEAFKDANGVSHAYNYDFSGSGVSVIAHDTWVAGVAVSRGGISHPYDIGVAPGADIYSARVVDNSSNIYTSYISNALDSLITSHNCRVIFSGIGLQGVDPNGSLVWTKIYDYYAYQYDVVFANPAGNSNTHLDVFGDAYNGLTTGGLIVTEPDVYLKVGYTSGSGPTSDNRKKPDVVAPSQYQTMPTAGSNTSWYEWTAADGATSFSTPHTAGAAALLIGLANKTAETNDGHNEVVRAVIVNSAFPNIYKKNGGATNPADSNNTWNADRGYGRVDALRAYQTLSQPPVARNVTTASRKGWAYYADMGSNKQHSYYITGKKNDRLIVTVTWNRQITKSGVINPVYTEETAPKFNIKVTVKDSSQAVIYTETNTLNNLKKIDLTLPADGVYEINLQNTTNKSRNYAFVFELIAPIVGDFEPLDYVVDNFDMAIFAMQWRLSGPNLEADLNNDGEVDFGDFAIFAAGWLETNPTYYQ